MKRNLSAEDRWAVADVVSGLCFAIDSRDGEGIRKLLTEGCIADFGPAGLHSGRESIATTILQICETVNATQHQITSAVASAAETGARVTSYFQAAHVKDGDLFTVAGVYVDDMTRDDTAGWRIAERSITVQWMSGNPAVLGVMA